MNQSNVCDHICHAVGNLDCAKCKHRHQSNVCRCGMINGERLKVWCPYHDGTGKANVCPSCNGTGEISVKHNYGEPSKTYKRKCQKCKGTGQANVCPNTNSRHSFKLGICETCGLSSVEWFTGRKSNTQNNQPSNSKIEAENGVAGRKSEPNYYCGAIAEGGYACFMPNPCKKHKGKSEPTHLTTGISKVHSPMCACYKRMNGEVKSEPVRREDKPLPPKWPRLLTEDYLDLVVDPTPVQANIGHGKITTKGVSEFAPVSINPILDRYAHDYLVGTDKNELMDIARSREAAKQAIESLITEAYARGRDSEIEILGFTEGCECMTCREVKLKTEKLKGTTNVE